MKRNALYVKPTVDDLRAAQDDFETEQKRVNRSYEKALKDREKWTAIRKRGIRRLELLDNSATFGDRNLIQNFA